MIVFAVDPGTSQSAFVVWDGQRVAYKGILPNSAFLDLNLPPADVLVCESVESFGMPVGKEIFETVFFAGRLCQRWTHRTGEDGLPSLFERVGRKAIKLHHCQSARAKDSNVIQALKDRFGDKGTKKAPGLTFGFKADIWQAFALAVYWTDTHPD